MSRLGSRIKAGAIGLRLQWSCWNFCLVSTATAATFENKFLAFNHELCSVLWVAFCFFLNCEKLLSAFYPYTFKDYISNPQPTMHMLSLTNVQLKILCNILLFLFLCFSGQSPSSVIVSRMLFGSQMRRFTRKNCLHKFSSLYKAVQYRIYSLMCMFVVNQSYEDCCSTSEMELMSEATEPWLIRNSFQFKEQVNNARRQYCHCNVRVVLHNSARCNFGVDKENDKEYVTETLPSSLENAPAAFLLHKVGPHHFLWADTVQEMRLSGWGCSGRQCHGLEPDRSVL